MVALMHRMFLCSLIISLFATPWSCEARSVLTPRGPGAFTVTTPNRFSIWNANSTQYVVWSVTKKELENTTGSQIDVLPRQYIPASQQQAIVYIPDDVDPSISWTVRVADDSTEKQTTLANYLERQGVERVSEEAVKVVNDMIVNLCFKLLLEASYVKGSIVPADVTERTLRKTIEKLYPVNTRVNESHLPPAGFEKIVQEARKMYGLKRVTALGTLQRAVEGALVVGYLQPVIQWFKEDHPSRPVALDPKMLAHVAVVDEYVVNLSPRAVRSAESFDQDGLVRVISHGLDAAAYGFNDFVIGDPFGLDTSKAVLDHL
ncbi:hypothetical protein HDV00_012776 [Rhizophlyctis rosea]|nr:hypothetical protein HDV00_012776 [Rhizophlyctis rosea]